MQPICSPFLGGGGGETELLLHILPLCCHSSITGYVHHSVVLPRLGELPKPKLGKSARKSACFSATRSEQKGVVVTAASAAHSDGVVGPLSCSKQEARTLMSVYIVFPCWFRHMPDCRHHCKGLRYRCSCILGRPLALYKQQQHIKQRQQHRSCWLVMLSSYHSVGSISQHPLHTHPFPST